MENAKPSSKMFLDIVGALKSLIREEGIKTGGRLPSERELAERLKAGRSTIREALRSLELLGLIETRRGEGTFLADFKKHQLVEVLAAFIMQQSDSVTDVLATRKLHETDAILTICRSESLRSLPVWESFLERILLDGTVLREDVVREMVIATENRLSLKIWFLLIQYSQIPLDKMTSEQENGMLTSLLKSLIAGESDRAILFYTEWIGLVESERGVSDK